MARHGVGAYCLNPMVIRAVCACNRGSEIFDDVDPSRALWSIPNTAIAPDIRAAIRNISCLAFQADTESTSGPDSRGAVDALVAMNKLKFFLLALTLSALSACKVDVAGELEKVSTISASTYERGHIRSQGALARGTTEYITLLGWARENSDEWSMALGSYVPDILFSGASFQLNITRTYAIIGIGRWQYKKSISDVDFKKLKQVAEDAR